MISEQMVDEDIYHQVLFSNFSPRIEHTLNYPIHSSLVWKRPVASQYWCCVPMPSSLFSSTVGTSHEQGRENWSTEVMGYVLQKYRNLTPENRTLSCWRVSALGKLILDLVRPSNNDRMLWVKGFKQSFILTVAGRVC